MNPKLNKQFFEIAEQELKQLNLGVKVLRRYNRISNNKIMIYTEPLKVKGNKAIINILKENDWMPSFTTNENGVQFKQFEKWFDTENLS